MRPDPIITPCTRCFKNLPETGPFYTDENQHPLCDDCYATNRRPPIKRYKWSLWATVGCGIVLNLIFLSLWLLAVPYLIWCEGVLGWQPQLDAFATHQEKKEC